MKPDQAANTACPEQVHTPCPAACASTSSVIGTAGSAVTPLLKGLGRYMSAKQLNALGAVTVGIAGAGGLGSNCAMLLVRSGVRKLKVVDFDVVEASNLNRQFYFPADIGMSKVEALRKNLLQLDSALELDMHNARLSAENSAVFFKNCAIVVEALDMADYKAVLCNALLTETKAFIVSASGMGSNAGAHGDIWQPMSRKSLGKRLICVGDFISEVNDNSPPLAPRVMQAAALEAEAVIEFILKGI